MKQTPATFGVASRALEREFRKAPGNFRRPPPKFTPSQLASEMALAACGVLYLESPDRFTRGALKHITYLHKHMTSCARPWIVLAFDPDRPFNKLTHPLLAELFTHKQYP